jgi:hypothetical protein
MVAAGGLTLTPVTLVFQVTLTVSGIMRWIQFVEFQ